MHVLPLVLVAGVAAVAAAAPHRPPGGAIAPVPGQMPRRELSRDSVLPYLAFPEPGLDDPAAYHGYQTRVYRDAGGNAFQVYLNRNSGRVVDLWADAADESAGFTVRDATGRPAELDWGSGAAAVAQSAGTRSVTYALEAPAQVTIGRFLLGSMRVERDFQYAGRDSLPFDATPLPQPELEELIDRLRRLNPHERARHLALLGVTTVEALRARLVPRLAAERGDTVWVVRVEQVSFDGRSHLWLALEGDARETVPTLVGTAVTIRRPDGGPVRWRVRVRTDAAALTPLTRADIFNDEFRRFYDVVRADTAHPERFRRLEREVRGMELLCYGEKLMAGLPNFATYFGRDMLMTALLMQPVWAPAMPEHVLGSALLKLSPEGDVSHEEALGGQAIRENAALYNRLVREGNVARARVVLAHLGATRENYIMVDDDVQLPIVAARYLADGRVPAERKRRFLREGRRAERLLANLAFVAREAAAYTRAPVPTNLVSFPRAPDGHWIGASWRDSRVGYGGGRFAMDVNVVWMPRALEAIGTILDALRRLGLSPTIRDRSLAGLARNRAALERAVAVWKGAERHFQIALAPDEITRRVQARLQWLPGPERDYWAGAWQRVGVPTDTLRFLALALDAAGKAIPLVNTDPAMLLLLDSLAPERVRHLIAPIVTPFPIGLFVDDLGPLVANDTYAGSAVWEEFRRDPYHSPTVVWGRDVNLLLAGLALQGARGAGGAAPGPFQDALQRIVTAVDRSGLRHAELWSYRITDGKLVPMRYGTSSDVQLWSLTDLAVQYLLNPSKP